MKKEVMITITGDQTVDGETDTIEVLTTGNYYRKNGNYYISYEESQSTGMEGVRTTIKVEDEKKVTMMRSGNLKTQFIIENQVRHSCYYDTGQGGLMIGVWGNQIISSLKDSGGMLSFKYTMDINTALASENKVTINIKEC